MRLLLSGTLKRADGRRILGLPYRRGTGGREEVDPAAPGLAVVGYSRARALAERAVLPVSFGALDGEASWPGSEAENGTWPHLGPHRLRAPAPYEATRPALFTALRTGFAEGLLRCAFLATRDLRADRRARPGIAPGQAARGLGKLLVVAPDQAQARRYLDILRGWVPPGQAGTAALAVSEERGAHETLAAFRLTPEPAKRGATGSCGRRPRLRAAPGPPAAVRPQRFPHAPRLAGPGHDRNHQRRSIQ